MKYFRITSICFFITYFLCAPHIVNAFWGSDYDEPPPITRIEPPNTEEVKRLKFGNKGLNEQVIRFGLAQHIPLIPDWSEKNLESFLPAGTRTIKTGNIQHL